MVLFDDLCKYVEGTTQSIIEADIQTAWETAVAEITEEEIAYPGIIKGVDNISPTDLESNDCLIFYPASDLSVTYGGGSVIRETWGIHLGAASKGNLDLKIAIVTVLLQGLRDTDLSVTSLSGAYPAWTIRNVIRNKVLDISKHSAEIFVTFLNYIPSYTITGV